MSDSTTAAERAVAALRAAGFTDAEQERMLDALQGAGFALVEASAVERLRGERDALREIATEFVADADYYDEPTAHITRRLPLAAEREYRNRFRAALKGAASAGLDVERLRAALRDIVALSLPVEWWYRGDTAAADGLRAALRTIQERARAALKEQP